MTGQVGPNGEIKASVGDETITGTQLPPFHFSPIYYCTRTTAHTHTAHAPHTTYKQTAEW